MIRMQDIFICFIIGSIIDCLVKVHKCYLNVRRFKLRFNAKPVKIKTV